MVIMAPKMWVGIILGVLKKYFIDKISHPCIADNFRIVSQVSKFNTFNR